MKKQDKALRWPYGIAVSFVLIIGLIYWTIVASLDYPVEDSDINLQNYHVYDKHVNDFIEAKIAFDKKYDFRFINNGLHVSGTSIAFSLRDKAGNPVKDATIEAVLTRPDTHKYDIKLQNPIYNEGTYTFEVVKLPKEGRWDIIAKVSVGDDFRFINLKADTRNSSVFEF